MELTVHLTPRQIDLIKSSIAKSDPGSLLRKEYLEIVETLDSATYE